MKKEEQNVVTCGTCGYKWEIGSISFHSCTEELQRELRRVRGVAVELREQLQAAVDLLDAEFSYRATDVNLPLARPLLYRTKEVLL